MGTTKYFETSGSHLPNDTRSRNTSREDPRVFLWACEAHVGLATIPREKQVFPLSISFYQHMHFYCD